ncbi:MAG: glycosyltransferase [Candidatus Woesearchaeota archaeon]
MNISVIIPTLNEEEHIENLLTSLNKQTTKVDEIIVVDGNSKDKTQELVKKSKVKLFVTKRGVGFQRNFGAQKAKGDLLIFLDADTILPRQFIKNTINEFKKRKLDYACPKFIPNPKGIMSNILFFLSNAIFYLTQKVQGNGGGPCIFIKKELFMKIKFEESIKFEDIILIRKAI